MAHKRLSQMPSVRSYAEAVEFLSGKKDRKYAHATYVEQIDEVTVGVRYHSTLIVRFYQDGATELQANGWFTPSTKERINLFLPAGARLGQALGKWYMHFYKVDETGRLAYDEATYRLTQVRVVDYFEGIQFYSPSEVYIPSVQGTYGLAIDANPEQDQKDYKRGKRFNGRRQTGAGPDNVWQRGEGRPATYYRSRR